ncbi:MAG: FAD:protein FMN transferase [Clostridiales Family XIII bacterium]|jgi:thiamine biosynthesis lipoprotein|nr:FAD:protein FMN transferase [Clostridiales Family XIII bacterium]
MKSNALIFCIAVSVFLLAVSGCGANPGGGQDAGEAPIAADESVRYNHVDFVMGTVVDITLYAKGADKTNEIPPILSEIENKLISWRNDDSELARINKGAGSPMEISDEMKNYLENAIAIAANSGGAFDPTVGGLSRLWDFDNEEEIIPGQEAIAELLNHVGYEKIAVEGNTISLTGGVSIDLGGIGKGIGCDEVQKYLEENEEITGALINIGGSSTVVYGAKASGEPWKIALQNPRDSAGYAGALTLAGTHYISTSGDYEKYFEKDGKRYHHILDPATGYPAESGLMSVTVAASSGALSDALSTACFVLGKEKSMALLSKYDAEAVFIGSDKNITVTDGLKENFELMSDDYRVV